MRHHTFNAARRMKYVIIEDEPLAADRLKAKIEELRPDWHCMAVLNSASSVRSDLLQLDADFVFADINLGDGRSIPVLREIAPDFPIIFTTAYDQYALESFKLNSIDYLLKPIHSNDLLRAIKKVEQKGGIYPKLEQLLSVMQQRFQERFILNNGDRLISVKTDDVAFLYAEGKYCFLTTSKGKDYILNYNLKDVLPRLNPNCFFQINRKFIIHINSITEMVPYSKGRVKLITVPPTPEEAIVSVDRSSKFKSWFEGGAF